MAKRSCATLLRSVLGGCAIPGNVKVCLPQLGQNQIAASYAAGHRQHGHYISITIRRLASFVGGYATTAIRVWVTSATRWKVSNRP